MTLVKICGLDGKEPRKLVQSIGRLTDQRQIVEAQPAGISNALMTFAPQLATVFVQQFDTQLSDLRERNAELSAEVSRLSTVAEKTAGWMEENA